MSAASSAPTWLMRALSVHPSEQAKTSTLAALAFCMSAAAFAMEPISGSRLAARMPVVALVVMLLSLPVAAAAYGLLARRLSRLSLGVLFSAGTIGLLLIGAISAWGTDFFSTPLPAVLIGSLLPRSLLVLLWLHATSIAVDTFDGESGPRLLPLVAAGSALGALAGHASAIDIYEAGGIAVAELIAAGFLLLGLGVAVVGERWWQVAAPSTQQEGDADDGEPVPWGYLIAITLLVLLLDVVREGIEDLFQVQQGGGTNLRGTSLVRLVEGSVGIVLMLFALARFLRAAGVTVALLGLLAAYAVWLVPMALFGSPMPQPWSWARVVAAPFVTPLGVAVLVLLLPLPRRSKYGPRVVLALLAGGLEPVLSANVIGRVIELLPARGAAWVVLALCAAGVPLAVFLGRRFESLTRAARANGAAAGERR